MKDFSTTNDFEINSSYKLNHTDLKCDLKILIKTRCFEDISFEMWVIVSKIYSLDKLLVINDFPKDKEDSKLIYNYFGDEFIISSSMIFGIRGDLDWTIANQYVKVSKRVLNGEKIGYFYGEVYYDDPYRFNRIYYSISQKDKIKTDLMLYKMPFVDLLIQDPVISDTFDCNSIMGFKRISENRFKQVHKQLGVNDVNSEIYPWIF